MSRIGRSPTLQRQDQPGRPIMVERHGRSALSW
jgi:hypothetical protein